MSGEFTLGQRVAYSEHIRRRASRPGESGGPDKIWSNNPGPGLDDQHWPGGKGIIVGKRTLSNGNTRWMGEDAGYIYDSLEHFTAYLIAYDLQRKPVHVLPEHITAMNEEPDHCPYDCDRCHDEDCPCDRLGCAGSGTGPLH